MGSRRTLQAVEEDMNFAIRWLYRWIAFALILVLTALVEAASAQEEEPKQAAAASTRSGGRSSGAAPSHASSKTRKRK